MREPHLPLRVRRRIAERTTRLAQLGFPGYAAYLKSGLWAAKKAAYREAAEMPQRCVICGGEGDLEMHHLTYDRAGAERLEDLAPVCSTCHQIIHALERRGELGLDFSGLVDHMRASCYRRQARARHQRRFAESDADRLAASIPRRRKSTERLLRAALSDCDDPDGLLDRVEATIAEAKLDQVAEVNPLARNFAHSSMKSAGRDRA